MNAHDFFSIIIWKANRAKSRVALRLLKRQEDAEGLNGIVRRLTTELYQACDHKERMRILIKGWGFRLPIASAILTVLWPDYFTVFDFRISEEFPEFRSLADVNDFEEQWTKYQNMIQAVRNANVVRDIQNLRDKDRYFWGKSTCRQLEDDIQQLFVRQDDDGD
ncbi:MAG: hypothetical protein ABSA12_06885 [Verrucomicrobiia bacterium]|jgi:hypothetical protein